MNIKSAITTEGMPVTIIPYSPEILAQNADNGSLQDVLLNRIEYFYKSYEYVKMHEEFDALVDEIEIKAPEFKKVLGRIHDMVTAKETEAFDAGYRAGMADLMTALTLNNLQITQTQLVDMEAIAERREVNVNAK